MDATAPQPPRESGRLPPAEPAGIEKTFGAVRTLNGVDLDVFAGEGIAL